MLNFQSLKQKFHGLRKPWKNSIYCLGFLIAFVGILFLTNKALEYQQIAAARSQQNKAIMLAEKSQKEVQQNPNYFPGKPPRTVNMQVDKSPHYYESQ